MIMGIVFVVFGYSVFYWGLHHFPGVDCPSSTGDSNSCRVSLWDALGVPSTWGITRGNPVQINTGSNNNPLTPNPNNPPGNYGCPPGTTRQVNPQSGDTCVPNSNQTQPQAPSNAKTPTGGVGPQSGVTVPPGTPTVNA